MNKNLWNDLISQLFLDKLPITFEWNNIEDILYILEQVSCAYNHVYFPDYGGWDLIKVNLSEHEEDCIEMDFGQFKYLVKPSKLIFNSFESDTQWFYFYLETKKILTSVTNDYRLLSGSFVFYDKDSLYNYTVDSYKGIHNKYTSSEYRSMIQSLILENCKSKEERVEEIFKF